MLLKTNLQIIGLIPTLTIFIVFCFPISIMFIFKHYIESKKEL
jgi:hypothetical protein